MSALSEDNIMRQRNQVRLANIVLQCGEACSCRQRVVCTYSSTAPADEYYASSYNAQSSTLSHMAVQYSVQCTAHSATEGTTCNMYEDLFACKLL